MSFSNFLETKVLGHVFGATAYTAAGTLYLALFTSNPAEDGSGTEVTGGAYARQSVAFTVVGNNASNTSAVEYATATAGYATLVFMTQLLQATFLPTQR